MMAATHPFGQFQYPTSPERVGEDRRGLTPLFWQHVLPYGEVKLDMTSRLSIRTAAPASSP